MPYPDAFLDELRTRLAVSVVVGRSVKLKRRGAEFVGLSPFNKEKTESFTVNDGKGFWHDFSADKHGDIFAFVSETEGCDFREAVRRCAEIAGIPLPANGHDHGRRLDAPAGNDGQAHARKDRDDGADGDASPPRSDRSRSQREITRAYDYTDAQGSLIYQVCRVEWQEDGRRKKTFMQRRPAPEGEGHWVWGLSAGEFIRGRNGDWYQATEDRIARWHDAERRTIADAAAHGLYRLPEFKELASPDEPVFILEGEKDVDTARGWDLVATTNSGGARHWRADHAEFFRGLDVVVPIDNDKAGQDRGEIIAKSLRKIARSVRVLDWAAVWPGAPKGADLTDWKEQAGGTPARLRGLVRELPEWTPRPFESKFGLILWGEHNRPGEEYDYLVEDLVPEREPVLLIGESQSGKSFFTMGMAMAGAEGRAFFGRRVLKPFGVVYCAYEAGKGFKFRMRAHEKHFEIGGVLPVPFAVLTKPVDLWSAEINTDQLVDEILGIAEAHFGDVGLGAVVIDTHNRANPGASEIESKDVSRIIDRYARIMERTHAGLWIIGHKNAAGKHRGNEQLYNNIETAIDISRKVREENKEKVPVRDDRGRPVRVATVLKQREGLDGESFEFVLTTEEVGINKYGKPRTSCVATSPAYGDEREQLAAARPDPSAISLTSEQQTILQALRKAIEEHGTETPPALRLPRAVKQVVNAKHWRDAYVKLAPDGDTAKDNTINARMKRASEKLQSLRIIGRDNPWVWITGRPVKGHIERSRYDEPYPGRVEPPLPDDIEDLIR